MPIVFDNITFTGGILLSGDSGTPGPTPLSDQYFQYTTLLLDGLGANNAQNNTFLNSSSVAKTITRNGNTTQGSFTTFSHSNGYWSNYFDGTGDYLGLASTFNAAMGGGLASGLKLNTIEFWVYPTQWSSANSYQHAVYGTYQAVSANGRWFVGLTGQANNGAGKLRFSYTTGTGTQTDLVATVANVPLNAWTHLAVTIDCSTASNSTIKFFVGGTLTETYTGQNLSTQTTNYTAPTIGGNFSNFVNNFAGNITNLRQIYGSLFYTSTFTPSTTPLTAVSGTILLTCQSNTFKDNSTNNFAITVNGDTTVSLFQPFALSSEYNSSTMGGSMYFDGNGDNLSIAADSSLNLVSGNFTIECWIYAFPMGSTGVILQKDHTSGVYSQYALELFTDGRIQASTSQSDNGSTGQLRTIVSSAIPYRTWHHIAFTRNGGTFYLYINGVQAGSTAANNTMTDNGRPLTVGSSSAGAWFNGYIQDVRIVKGTAVYTANFTPPTAPLTNISGTSLLLNGTNAGIVDSTGFNDLQTVGNAQISTAQSKWGGSSLFFDGSGDYLIAPRNITIQPGSNNFTLETWFYQLSRTAGEYDGIFRLDGSGTGFNAGMYLSVGAGVDGYSFLVANTAKNGWAVRIILSGGLPALDTWHHIAIVRNSDSWVVYLNGNSVGSATFAGAVNTPTGTFQIGWAGTTNSYFHGYMQGFRYTQGVARYTTSFTPPTNY